MRTRSVRARTVLGALLVVLMLAVALVGISTCVSTTPDEPEEPAVEPTATPEPGEPAEPAEPGEPEGTSELTIYLVRGETLGVTIREVPGTVAVARAALEELLAGPSDLDDEAGLTTAIPEGTRLNDVSVADGVATVDLSPEFESGGGSLSMQLRVSQVVFTLTSFPTVDAVAFMIDGQPVEAIGGEGVMVDPPVSRAVFADNTLPAILLESPGPWQEVSSPLRIIGTSNTFEATFNYEIVDPAGAIVAEGFGTATAGMGTWGTFDVTVPYEIARPGVGALIVFESSAKDGSRINLVEIPLRMGE
ncbi:MAG: GerMN domain-containing protein [Anaerosomatales bacterium]|nr:GerMN domain-containing protein [Anaerosomatales bacterium]